MSHPVHHFETIPVLVSSTPDSLVCFLFLPLKSSGPKNDNKDESNIILYYCAYHNIIKNYFHEHLFLKKKKVFLTKITITSGFNAINNIFPSLTYYIVSNIPSCRFFREAEFFLLRTDIFGSTLVDLIQHTLEHSFRTRRSLLILVLVTTYLQHPTQKNETH